MGRGLKQTTYFYCLLEKWEKYEILLNAILHAPPFLLGSLNSLFKT
jgi:hypothetical protein